MKSLMYVFLLAASVGFSNEQVGSTDQQIDPIKREVTSAKEEKKSGYFGDFLFEAKAAYFLPTGERFEKIYHGAGIYGLEFTCQAKDFVFAWASVDFFIKSGHAYGACSQSSTNVWFLPLAAGVKFFFPVNLVDLWVGGGISGTYVHVEDKSPDVIPEISKWGVGGIVKAGAIINCTKYLFVDLFTNYSFLTIPFHDTRGGTVIPHKGDLSGWSFGGSIGYRFGERYKRS